MKINSSNLKIDLLSSQKLRTSFVWQYFGHLIKIGKDNKEELICGDRTFCEICLKIESKIENNFIDIDNFKKTSSYKLSNQSTNSLKNHLSKHKIFEENSVEQNSNILNNLLNRGIVEKENQESFNLKLAMCLISTNTSYNFIENEFVRKLFESSLLPGIQLPHRKTISNNVIKIYTSIYQSITSFLSNSNIEFASIDLDICHNKIKNENYLGMNFHFVLEGKLNNIFLGKLLN